MSQNNGYSIVLHIRTFNPYQHKTRNTMLNILPNVMKLASGEHSPDMFYLVNWLPISALHLH